MVSHGWWGAGLSVAQLSGGYWACRRCFLVHTSLHPPVEHVYTTVIDRDNCGITEADAESMAREIEGQATGNMHLLEERGFVDDSGVS